MVIGSLLDQFGELDHLALPRCRGSSECQRLTRLPDALMNGGAGHRLQRAPVSDSDGYRIDLDGGFFRGLNRIFFPQYRTARSPELHERSMDLVAEQCAASIARLAPHALGAE